MIDAIDGDPEPDPSLGYASCMGDREGDPADDRLEDTADDEPSLGWP